jgi:UDP-N-acetylmuramate--alanine ligase
MDLTRIKKVYMIGIKGVGMTMLAQFLAAKGLEVSGSDTSDTFMTDQVLARANIKVLQAFAEDNVPKDVDLIIYSTAYNVANNIEVAKAVRSKVRHLTYAEGLAEIFNAHYGVAVIGSAGKTTTTAWLGWVLSQAGKEPNVMVGSRVPQFDGSILIGQSDTLVIEADEYQNKLRYFFPKVVLLNNIDYDHPDYFKTEADYTQVFVDFIKKIPAKGLLVANFDDPLVRKFAPVNTRARVVSYGLKGEVDFLAYDLRNQDGRQFFKVRMRESSEPLAADPVQDKLLKAEVSELGVFSIGLPGRHNVYNALAVIASALELGTTLLDLRKSLGTFNSTNRRMEKLGVYHGVTIYDDYAHHPVKVKAAMSGIRQLYPKNELIVVFQPHTFTRTLALLDQFAESFALADELIVLDIYGSAREAQGGVHANDLIDKIESLRPQGFAPARLKYLASLTDCTEYLRARAKKGQVILLMGAGDVFKIGQQLLANK